MPIAQLSGNENIIETAKSKTFIFDNEDHTLGNALRTVISAYPNVQFCGYTVPHPAEKKMHLRIQVTRGSAVDALQKGLEDLSQMCDFILDNFEDLVQKFEVDKMQQQNV